jgi:hypothetical protein
VTQINEFAFGEAETHETQVRFDEIGKTDEMVVVVVVAA